MRPMELSQTGASRQCGIVSESVPHSRSLSWRREQCSVGSVPTSRTGELPSLLLCSLARDLTLPASSPSPLLSTRAVFCCQSPLSLFARQTEP